MSAMSTMTARANRAGMTESRPRNRISARLARLAAAASTLAAAAALALAPATAASAHDYLVSSTPAADSTVTTATPRVTLVFDDIVLAGNGHGALIQVTDASGRNFETDCASVQGRDVSVPVALGDPGVYRVTWQVVSADGHPVSDSIQFTYQGPKAGDGRAGPLAKCGTTVTAPAASGQAATPSEVSPLVIGIIIAAGAVVLLGAAAVVVVLVVSSRRKAD